MVTLLDPLAWVLISWEIFVRINRIRKQLFEYCYNPRYNTPSFLFIVLVAPAAKVTAMAVEMLEFLH